MYGPTALLTTNLEQKTKQIASLETSVEELKEQIKNNGSPLVPELNQKIKDLENLIAEAVKARDDSNQKLNQIEKDKKLVEDQLSAAQAKNLDLETKVAELEARTTALQAEKAAAEAALAQTFRTVQSSIRDIRGLWINQKRLDSITDGQCYEFVHVAADGAFSQVLACVDGRVQLHRQPLASLSAMALTPENLPRNADFESTYGFVLVGGEAKSSCANPVASLLVPGNRGVFEMSLQDFGPEVTTLASRYMVVPTDTVAKPFMNLALVFGGTNDRTYESMLAFANRPSAGPLSKASAVALGGIEGKLSAGCFASDGTFN